MLYDLLLAPYHESSHYQITAACVYLDHPMRPRTSFGVQRCICGMKKAEDPPNVTVTGAA